MKRKSSNGLPEEADIVVGRRVRAARDEKGWSQDQLAQACGITFQQIQKYEHGVNRISVSRLIQICDALEIDVAALLGGLQVGEKKRSANLDLNPDEKRMLKALSALDNPIHRRAALKLIEGLAKK